ncbi:lysosomal proton-coupled steroid conjugate and bile acid symporter SLC46A3-like [Lineus longissimus]|uniref:lysosomal proton-coupled steroid conjugate and bile acid symporter SLC46A3-like n=1 Tax=Lineus longissimus TaxID=88925 RepID=UPI00315DEB32
MESEPLLPAKAPIPPKQRRGFRITILIACKCVAFAASKMATGYFIKGHGYTITTLTFGCIQLVNLAFIFIFVQETITRDKNKDKSLKKTLKRIKGVFKNSENRRNVKVILLSAMFFFYEVPLGGNSLQILYVLNAPLCWGPVLIGIYGALSGLSGQVAGLVSLKLLKQLPISDIVITALGCLSAIGGCLVNAWAVDDIFMYLVSIVSLLMALPPSLIRSTISCLLKSDEQGTVLAVGACVEVASYLTVSPLINIIYQHTIFFMPGFAFLVCAGLEGITLTLIMIYICHDFYVNKTSRLLSTSQSSLNSRAQSEEDDGSA